MDNEVIRNVQMIQLEMMKELHILCEKYNLKYFLCEGSLLGAIRHKGFIPWDDDLDIVMPREDYEALLIILQKDSIKDCYLDCYETNAHYWLPFAKLRKKNTVYKEKALEMLDDKKCGIWIDIFPLDYSRKENSIITKLKKVIIESIKYRLEIKNLNFTLKNFSRRWIPIILFWSFFSDNTLKCLQRQMTKTLFKNRKYYVNYGSTYNVKKVTNSISCYEPLLVDFEDTKFYIPSKFDILLKKVYGNYMELPPQEKRKNHSPIKIEY